MPSAIEDLKTNPEKLIFALGFLRSLSKINTKKPFDKHPDTDNSQEEKAKRVQKIKVAAYSSMARTVGRNRAWSRALLWRLQKKRRAGFWRKKEKKGSLKRKHVKKKGPQAPCEPSQTDKLRKLVPGGEAMDICSLMEESAHYIKCLAMQVNVMQSIVDHISA